MKALPNSNKKLYQLLYSFWLFTLIVILWGAWVRISHSGNGCGDHWPMCQGELIPDFKDSKTWVEYTHRLMSGVYGLIVIYIFYFFHRNKSRYSKQSVKLSAILLILMIIEAGLGALLVKQSLVTVNDSVFRLVAMSFHQLNSFLLTGTTYLLAQSVLKGVQITHKGRLVFFLLVCMTGAIAALSTTLFPSVSLWEGILKDFTEDAHLFVRLRILHPLFALGIIGYFTYSFFNKNENRQSILFFVALCVGILTLILLSPVWLKLLHLFMAHWIWAELIGWLVRSRSTG